MTTLLCPLTVDRKTPTAQRYGSTKVQEPMTAWRTKVQALRVLRAHLCLCRMSCSRHGQQLQEIVGADGLELDGQINQLVAAMATYKTNNPSFDPTTATQMPSDATLQGTIGTAWRSLDDRGCCNFGEDSREYCEICKFKSNATGDRNG
ncbi:hypothetical protein [Bradyrhizobium sp. USDA 4502]